MQPLCYAAARSPSREHILYIDFYLPGKFLQFYFLSQMFHPTDGVTTNFIYHASSCRDRELLTLVQLHILKASFSGLSLPDLHKWHLQYL